MIGKFLGRYKITNLMLNHSIAKRQNKIVRTIFKVFGPLIIKIFGYPLKKSGRERAMKIMQHISLKENQEVLDFGCGIGYFSLEFALNHKCKVTGVDIDKEDVTLANKIKNILKCKNVKFISGKIDSKKYAKKFDRILCSEVLEHIKDDGSYLSMFAKILKDTGEILITVPYSRSPAEFKKQELNLSGTEGGHVRNGYNLSYFKNKLNNGKLIISKYDYCGNKHSLLVVLRKI